MRRAHRSTPSQPVRGGFVCPSVSSLAAGGRRLGHGIVVPLSPAARFPRAAATSAKLWVLPSAARSSQAGRAPAPRGRKLRPGHRVGMWWEVTTVPGDRAAPVSPSVSRSAVSRRGAQCSSQGGSFSRDRWPGGRSVSLSPQALAPTGSPVGPHHGFVSAPVLTHSSASFGR